MTHIERFAEKEMGVRLTTFQLQLISGWAEGRVTYIGARQAGVTTAMRVLRSYIKRIGLGLGQQQ